jgi:hypothetical protein
MRIVVDFYEKIHGRDETPLEENYEVKSIGEQETFEQTPETRSF